MTIADIMQKSTDKAKSQSTVKVSILTEVEEDDVAVPAINNEFEDCCGSDNCVIEGTHGEFDLRWIQCSCCDLWFRSTCNEMEPGVEFMCSVCAIYKKK